MKPPLERDDYQPLSRKRKLLVLLMAITMGIAVTLTILFPPGGVKRHPPPPPPDAPRCSAGQTNDCVGGLAQVLPLALPPAMASTPAAAAASATSARQ